MSTDIDRIMAGLEHFDNLWACPIEVACAVLLLRHQLGMACLAPIAVTIGMLASNRLPQHCWANAFSSLHDDCDFSWQGVGPDAENLG